ncbi:excinuclease ABC subunit UvrA [Ancylomarina sp. 16SWW S1-10-2]|uniref:excinuclease ABC subunit UvrA n=1 Tax=Ancylomarina sp. 16SWW S1-10-2 TaxID=2499681 RepID=UPI0012ADB160|nr:excinuclease ABC subunit UvrA [Ancylomarina sp. 16SWW S1-10-2]MRT93221.1 excinuclease ABC subunit A [Ancylomarina sp. 16SWW S1-10-2]
MIKQDKFITIKGARVHNLKNIDLKIPRNKFIVITGLSGSGKSSLAFDTLYAEGQRRYVESLSAYARQFLGRINKPEVDFIKGIPPAIAIKQKVNTRNPRSTVGTSTEIYDYLKLLFARIGKTYSPISNTLVKRHSVSDVVNFALDHEENTTVMIMTELHPKSDRSRKEQLEVLSQQGFSRIEIKGKALKIFDVLEDEKLLSSKDKILIIIDRLRIDNNKDTQNRLADSIQTAFYEGEGECLISVSDSKSQNYHSFSNRFEADGIIFEDPNIHTFSFNNPVGACPRCEGFGKVIGIDKDLVIPNKTLSIYEDAIVCWKGEKMRKWKDEFVLVADKFDFPIHKPYLDLSDEQKQLLWTGNKHFKGLDAFFAYVESKQYKIQFRVMLSRYRGKTVCPDCRGTRLKKEAGYVKITGKSIQDLVLMPISELNEFFNNIKLEGSDIKVSKRLLIEIQNRLQFLSDVGLGYLTLNRLSSSLSGGESQRINLATSLGSSLVGSLYILDEPSIGLHSKDTELLIKVLRQLRDLGNTVVVVEHDEDIILAADQVIDIGPYAGRLGGELVFQGNLEELKSSNASLTSQYISKSRCIPTPTTRRKWNNYIEIIGASENNLKSLDVKFPLNAMTLVTGVSGSGKSSLIKTILYPALKKHYGGYSDKSGHFNALRGDLHMISNVEFVDQNPIGKSSRSNPVTYLKAYDEIRKLYADQQASKYSGFKSAHFSFNIDGGRCDECQGEGIIKVEMQFMADVYLQCESCKGRRFKDEILEVRYRGKNIHDILEMTVNEATEFFMESTGKTEKKIAQRLKPLVDVGLGYVKLGQASSTLSGGESQRVKLASFLAKEKAEPCLFIFDEPTTGLHFHDINKLMDAFNALISRGHSLIVIEHNMEVIKCADWIIDLGPEGGVKGGNLCFEGLPEDIIKKSDSYTGKYLKEKL